MDKHMNDTLKAAEQDFDANLQRAFSDFENRMLPSSTIAEVHSWGWNEDGSFRVLVNMTNGHTA
ncbi:MAG: hypothetical protein WB870_09440 [Gallionellaceae bacterium]